ncbi:penicillin-binding transpeptidase domain-containing protein [Granulicella cerasi]|uniref:Penicillin-binding transpeptidase domain-containing protein n=1 Tax=Granulicella cerasi TaxID=741063 RepID=A0ABW1ZDA2_9BACT|nr:penicillin-binding transpeptidase domain-containing protein [Granulicella cerasi]
MKLGLAAVLISAVAATATAQTHKRPSAAHAHTAAPHHSAAHQAAGAHHAPAGRSVRRQASSRHVVAHRGVRVHAERFYTSSFVTTPQGQGDVVDGEDPVVRAAAIEALGNMNGTVLAIDPSSGRILTIVNQKLALSAGAEPCSTIKVMVALAGLKEGLVKADTPVSLGGHYSLDLTHALAKSVNLYFEVLGRALGFERVKHYANEFGLGELAGYNIAGEQLGTYPDVPLPQAQGGVGRMCSFGESINMTPLQLGAMVSSIANGGTLYYLQHPTTPQEVKDFQPKVKRLVDIKDIVPEIMPGMSGAVNYGTARGLHASFVSFPVLGKTGTCSNNGTRYGWFVSYGDAPTGRIVTVVFLNGDHNVAGPRAAELTGVFYKAMQNRNYFAPNGTAPSQQSPTTSASLVGASEHAGR